MEYTVLHRHPSGFCVSFTDRQRHVLVQLHTLAELRWTAASILPPQSGADGLAKLLQKLVMTGIEDGTMIRHVCFVMGTLVIHD